MRRALATLLIASALVVATGVAAARLREPGPPELTFTDDTPADVRALARRTWGRFLHTFPSRLGCLDPATVHGAWELDDRGSYDADTATIQVRIPGTAPNLEATLVHEFAHHLEASCADHVGLRASFLRIQGSPSDTPWFDGTDWSSVPSEQLAEAMTVAVLQRRPWHLAVRVDPAAVERIRRWGEGG
jgi:hypothetical protein